MITTETLLIKLDVNPKELSKAKIMLLNDLVERYNHGYMPVSYTHLTLPTNREV